MLLPPLLGAAIVPRCPGRDASLRALKSGTKQQLAALTRSLSERAEREAEGVVLLGRGTKAAAVKQAKEAKEAAREARLALSPRSLALREAAEAKDAERRCGLSISAEGHSA